ncbi:hypothetical protein [Trichothermofontia sp.]
MHLQPLRSPELATYLSGDVVIHRDAVIAPGVVMLADPGSRILIGAGVCIGLGAILHAHGGDLTIEAGVTLGAGVLVVGSGSIGANTCVGATTTVFNTSIACGQLIPPASLLGDTSRQIAGAAETPILEAEHTVFHSEVRYTVPQDSVETPPSPPPEPTPTPAPTATPTTTPPTSESPASPSPVPEPEPSPKPPGPVFGKAHFERLRYHLFSPPPGSSGAGR